MQRQKIWRVRSSVASRHSRRVGGGFVDSVITIDIEVSPILPFLFSVLESKPWVLVARPLQSTCLLALSYSFKA